VIQSAEIEHRNADRAPDQDGILITEQEIWIDVGKAHIKAQKQSKEIRTQDTQHIQYNYDHHSLLLHFVCNCFHILTP
jgi:hypothetical protein